MIHPVFRLAAAQPLLLAEHAAAYADLVSEEIAIRTAHMKRRLTLQIVGGVGLAVAVVLAGVAILLWASMPEGGIRVPWLMLLTPAVPAVLGGWALWLAQDHEAPALFANLRLQFARDAALLRVPPTP